MATNDILPFAQGGTALVQTQAAYSADAERLVGNQPGVARPDFVNKTLRQTAAIAAGLGDFLANNQASNVTDALTPAALRTIIENAIRSLVAVPAGIIVWLPGTFALPLTLKCNGALLSRATYARLWTYATGSGNVAASDALWAGATGMFSPGDGATTFRVPDLRGYSFRAWDDGRGIDAGRIIGSMQADQNVSHAHGVSDPTHAHGVSDSGHAHSNSVTYCNEDGIGNPWGSGNPATPEGDFSWSTNISGTGISIQASATGISIQAQGGSEVRVKSIALMPVIYY